MILLNEVVMGDRNDVGQGRLIIVAGPIRSGSTFLYVSYERFSNAFAIHTICFGEPFDDFIESFY